MVKKLIEKYLAEEPPLLTIIIAFFVGALFAKPEYGKLNMLILFIVPLVLGLVHTYFGFGTICAKILNEAGGKGLQVKRLDKTLPLPAYQTPGSVGLDLFVAKDIEVGAKDWALIPLNIIAKAPKGTFLGILPRSSTFKKTGLMLANSLGVVDQDYCGPEDVIMAFVYNTKDEVVMVNKGDRLFQMLVFKVETPQVVEVEKVLGESRGGFGSTDK